MSALKKNTPTKQEPDRIRDLAKSIHDALVDAKSINPVVLDVRNKTSFADYIIVASGTSDRQVVAIASRIQDAARKDCNRKPIGIEGVSTGLWALIDFGDIVCHVFQDELRDFYRIEGMWHDATEVNFSGKTAVKKAPSKKAVKVEKPAKAAAKKPAKKADKKPIKKAVKKVVKKIVKKAVKKPTKKVTKKITKKPAKRK